MLIDHSDASLRALPVLADVATGTLLLLLTCSIVGRVRRMSGATCHLIYSAAIIGVVVLPFASRLVPWSVWNKITSPSVVFATIPSTRPHPTQPARLQSDHNLPKAVTIGRLTHPQRSSGAAERNLSGNIISTRLADSLVLHKTPTQIAENRPSLLPSADQVGSVADWLLGAWLVGVVVLMLRLLAAYVQLRRICASAEGVKDKSLLAEMEDAAKRVGQSRSVEMCISDRYPAPMTCGIWRPTIVLPSSLVGDSAAARKSVLLHEMAHVRRHDAGIHLILQIAATIRWFDPLTWWTLRLATYERERACDDAVLCCDITAPEYAGHLVSIANQWNCGSMLRSLAVSMSTCSRLENRVAEILRQKPFAHRSGVRRSTCITIALTMFAAIGLLSTLSLSSAKTVVAAPQASTGEDKDDSNGIQFRVLNATTGKPIPGATVRLSTNDQSETRQTGIEGVVRIPFTIPEDPGVRVHVFVGCNGFTPMTTYWSCQRAPHEFTFRMPPGETWGGRVVSEGGEPIADATLKVAFSGRPGKPGETVPYARDETVKTDEAGQWRSTILPHGNVDVSINVSHDRFVSRAYPTREKEEIRQLRMQLSELRMEPGHVIEGRVTDPDGKSVPGAVIALGSNYGDREYQTTETGPGGCYRIGNAQLGSNVLTAISADWAPQLRPVKIIEGGTSVDFQLKKGHPVKLQVIDSKTQKPVSGFMVSLTLWRELRTLNGTGFRDRLGKTDENGMWTWPAAPDDPVSYSILKMGYRNIRRRPIWPSDDVQVIQVDPQLKVSGNVTDARTHAPIEEFELQVTYDTKNGIPRWNQVWRPEIFFEGEYSINVSEPNADFFIKFIAESYGELVMPVSLRGESLRLDAKLQPRATDPDDVAAAETPLRGTVRYSDGEPVVGASYMLRTGGDVTKVTWQGMSAWASRDFGLRTTKAGGRYEIPAEWREYSLVVMHDWGYAIVPRANLLEQHDVPLQPWASLVGKVWSGNRPHPAEDLSVHVSVRVGPGRLDRSYWSYEVTTDADGIFVIPRIAAGAVTIGRRISVLSAPGSPSALLSGRIRTNTSAGETTRVDLGASGRPVFGQVIIRSDAAVSMPPCVVTVRPLIPRSNETYYQVVGADGRFRVENVPEGIYDMSIVAVGEQPTEYGRSFIPIGTYSRRVMIPAGAEPESNEPLDVGQCELQIRRPPQPGETVKELEGLRSQDGTAIRLRGVPTVIHFGVAGAATRSDPPKVLSFPRTEGEEIAYVAVVFADDHLAIPNWERGPKSWTTLREPLDSELANVFGVTTSPCWFVVDQDGSVIESSWSRTRMAFTWR